MKILFLSHQSAFIYGGEICTLEMLKALRAEGVALQFALPDGPYRERASSIVPCLPLSSVEFRRSIFLLPRFFISLLRVWKELRIYHSQEKFLCVHATSLKSFVYALPFALTSKVPVIWHHHDILPVSLANDIWQRVLGSVAAKMLVPAEAAKTALIRAGVDGEKIQVLRNGFPVQEWKQRKPREQGSAFRIGMIGEISYRKRSDWIFPVLNILEKGGLGFFHLDVVGEGLSDPEFAEKVKKENALFVKRGIVRFLGRRNDVPDLLQEIDALFVPSRQDPLPTVIVEAGLSGVPVVAFPAGGIPEMVEQGENGFLCDNLEACAEAFVKLRENIHLWKKLSVRARALAEERYSASRISRELLGVYRQLR